ncbi:hypothetical protein CHU00_15825 [Sphingobacterium cellulitidis]|uniref:FecR family protein n=1 Tax=Sphingobacterium cellulitidis TaxID=1768011 RepID=UPI000B943FB8|nr:FecR domain-containing protein [Sphingobacterium cellulitidis]OYD44661.1 hypothetical protein CHU00_15825 [Sphingobacterium cellulitidis]
MEDLLIKYISGSASPEEKREVMDWVQADQNNKKEFEALQNTYYVSLWTDDLEIQEEEEENIVSLVREPLWKKLLKIAAVFLIGFSVLLNLKNYWEDKGSVSSDKRQSVHVPSGQRVEVDLVDGSKVWVNANSKLEYPAIFNQSERIVHLDGEGKFEVKPDEKLPFIVRTQDFDIKVLGTTFNVKSYRKKKNFETALIEGKVEITNIKSQQKIQLKPNELAKLENGKLVVSNFSSLDPYRWTEGLLTFENESIEDILNRVEEYFGATIIIENKNLKDKKYTGKFWIDDGIEDMLDVLQKTNDFKYSRNYDTKEYIIY